MDGIGEGAERRLKTLEDRGAIQDLVHRYAFNVRTGNPAACASLFADDATFETRDANPLDPAAGRVRTQLSGRDAIIAHITNSAGSDARVFPSITNLLIEVDGTQATASCLMSARVWPGGGQVSGEYRDTFRFEKGWRFQSRLYTMFS